MNTKPCTRKCRKSQFTRFLPRYGDDHILHGMVQWCRIHNRPIPSFEKSRR